MVGSLQPLDQKFAIVDDQGRPTDYFIRWAQQRQIDIGDGITLGDLQTYLEDNNLSNVQEILDQITTTRGSILYRGASAWAALAPGTAGYLLSTAGAGADPSWIPPPSSGGGSTPTIRAHNSGVYNAASVVVPFPAGTVAGDLVIVYWENGFRITTEPAGWTPLWVSNTAGTFTNQACAAKIMTAADITTGSVTVTASGAFNGFWGIVTIDGATFSKIIKMEHFDSPGADNIAAASVWGMLNIATTDLILCFSSTRSNQIMTVSANMTVLRSSAGANASGLVCSIASAAPGQLGLDETITAAVGNNGVDWTTLALRGP